MSKTYETLRPSVGANPRSINTNPPTSATIKTRHITEGELLRVTVCDLVSHYVNSPQFNIVDPLNLIYTCQPLGETYVDGSVNPVFVDGIFKLIRKDVSYIETRAVSETAEYIYYTMLPNLGKAIETAFIREEPLEVPFGWELIDGTRLPKYMNWAFNVLFAVDGSPIGTKDLRPTDVDQRNWRRNIARCLRQHFLVYSKVKSTARTKSWSEAVKSFEDRVSKPRHTFWSNPEWKWQTYRQALLNAKAFILDVFGDEQHGIHASLAKFLEEPWGRHGNGAVADRSDAIGKWDFKIPPSMPARLYEWAREHDIGVLSDTVPSSRVACVPKDHRGPRVICIEPKEYQFAQQGLMEVLVGICHEHPMLCNHIDFKSVEKSQMLCFDRNISTIDLKDASDNLSLDLVKALFPPWLYQLLTRFRTPFVNGARVSCYATMGSALCFPVQTIVFLALAIGLIQARRGIVDHSRKTKVRVFGDDIIVPRSHGTMVCEMLSACGLVVNRSKTCLRYLVKESCGEWVYDGESSRLVKPTTIMITNAVSWLSFVEYIALAEKRGFWYLSELFRERAQQSYVPPIKWSKQLYKFFVLVPTIVQKRPRRVTDYAALYAWCHRSNTNAPSFRRTSGSLVKWKWVAQVTE